MGRPVVHFAVYCDDAERAMAFYRELFGWSFEPWGPPGYWKIETNTSVGATAGALSQRTGPRGEGAPNAFRCTIAVPDTDDVIARAEASGGRRASPTAHIPGVGKVAELEDPEGNLLCLMAYEAGSPFHQGD